jgi:hypothetical protein
MITTEHYRKPCGCRSAGECTHNIFAEYDALDALVDAFAAEMKKKLHEKEKMGASGWDDRSNEQFIIDRLLSHVRRLDNQEIDIANLSAMLWNLRLEV